MKKTISLTEDQVLELLIAIKSKAEQVKGLQRFELEQGDKKGAAEWAESAQTLERVAEKIRRAKWRW